MIRLFTTILVLVLLIPCAQAQDVHFSQFANSTLLINPATAGVYHGKERVTLNYKSQWSSLGSPYTTYAASFERPFFRKRNSTNAHIGAGLHAYQDQAGDANFGTSQINLSLSGILPMNDVSTLSIGLQGGAAQKSADLANLTWGNQFDGEGFDPDLPSFEIDNLSSSWYVDFGAGVFYEYIATDDHILGRDYLQFNIGLAYHHVNKPTLEFAVGEDKLIEKYVGHIHMRRDIPDTYWSVLPSIIHIQQGPHRETYVGSLLRYRFKYGTKYTGMITESALSFGVSYRFEDALIPQVYYEVSSYKIGISYDFTVSPLTETAGFAAGGFEISFVWANMYRALDNKKPKGGGGA